MYTVMATADMAMDMVTGTTNIGTAIGTVTAAGGGTTAGTAGAASAGCKRPRVGSGPATRRFHARGVANRPAPPRPPAKQHCVSTVAALSRSQYPLVTVEIPRLIRPRDCTTEKDWLRSSTSASAPRSRSFPGTILLSEGETSGGSISGGGPDRGAARRYRGRNRRRCRGRVGECRAALPAAYRDRAGQIRSASMCSTTPRAFSNRIRKSVFLGRCSPSGSTPRPPGRSEAAVRGTWQPSRHGGRGLETLIHQQHEDFTLGPERETDPRL